MFENYMAKMTGQQRKITAGSLAKSKAGNGLSCTKSGTSFKPEQSKQTKTGNRASKSGSPGSNNIETREQPLHCHTQPPSLQAHIMGTNLQKTSSELLQGSPEKLKLQLFPIDEVTRDALEKDNHNPYLELLLGTRKKISSVLRHLNTKWGNSAPASGELILFPSSARLENLSLHTRWTLEDSGTTTAADVYAAVGNPPVFRLRYGWFSNQENDTLRKCNGDSLSWVDSKISFQAILSRVAPSGDNTSHGRSLSNATSDSFDAALLALKAHGQATSTHSQVSSIWEAEETCHPFPFNSSTLQGIDAPASSRGTLTSFMGFQNVAELGSHVDADREHVPGQQLQVKDGCAERTGDLQPDPRDGATEESKTGMQQHVMGSQNDSNYLWTSFDSYAAATSSRQIMGGDNISVNGLIESSMDAFQTFSIF